MTFLIHSAPLMKFVSLCFPSFMSFQRQTAIFTPLIISILNSLHCIANFNIIFGPKLCHKLTVDCTTLQKCNLKFSKCNHMGSTHVCEVLYPVLLFHTTVQKHVVL